MIVILGLVPQLSGSRGWHQIMSKKARIRLSPWGEVGAAIILEMTYKTKFRAG